MGQLRIELRAGAAGDDLDHLRRRFGRLVAVGGGHRLVGVADLDNARQAWDLFAGEAVRVTAAVPALVMAEYRARDLVAEERLDQRGADADVFLQDAHLVL